MDWIILVIAFILGAISMFMTICIGYAAKQEEPVNRVHFYVARNKSGDLWLYLGKPIRGNTRFYGNVDRRVIGLTCVCLERFGLNRNNYDFLKWEDEPVEVFINVED